MPATQRILAASPRRDLITALLKESACHRNWNVVGPVNLREQGRLELACCSVDVILIEAEDLMWLLVNRPQIIEGTLARVQTVVILSDNQLLDAVTLPVTPQGFLLRDVSGQLPIGLLALALDGYLTGPKQLLNQLSDNRQRLDIVAMFSADERRILSYLGHGLPNQEIAESIGLPISRVKTLVYILTRKLRMKNRTAVAVFAATNGFLTFSTLPANERR